MRRVLTPGGQLLFVEHGRSPDESVRRWQDRLTPAWKCIGGGCHLNRAITALIETAGFNIDHLETGRSEEHTSETQSPMRSSNAVFCLKKTKASDTPTLQERTEHIKTPMSNAQIVCRLLITKYNKAT